MQVKVVKKQSFPFDEPLALAEARNAEMLFNLHLSRCDSETAAEYLQNIFARIADKFAKKKLDLREKVS